MRRVIFLLAIVGAIAALLPGGLGAPRHAGATTLTVNSFTDSYDGSCADADCSLRDAVASAGDGDVVRVPPGFYPLSLAESGTPGDGSLGDGSLEIRTSIAIEAPEGGAFLDGTLLGAPIVDVAGGTTVAIRSVTAFGATTTGPAGFAWVQDARVTLDHVTVSGGQGEVAGAVMVEAQGRLVMRASLVTENRGTDGSGGIDNRGTVSVRDSTFLRNVGRKGGGVRNASGAKLDLLNVTVANNRVHRLGGGLYLRGDATLVNVTIAGNRAARGGGIAPAQPAASARLTIVAGNRATERGAQCLGPLTSLGDNVEQGRRCGFDAAGDRARTDPSLGRTTSNGGPTPTMSLHAGSPALDLGGTCGRRDQRGAPRDGRCDAGAYERVLCLGRPVNIVGTPGDEELSGGREPDTFLGLGGDDEFQGSLADDRACGGRGRDHLIGGPGPDVLVGGLGADELEGEEGNDLLRGGAGPDGLDGGPGRDRCVALGSDDLVACETEVSAQRTTRRRSGGQ